METETIKKKLKIAVGVATVVLDKDGVVIEAMFDPMTKIKDCTDLVSALKHLDGPIDGILQKQSELIVGAWFSKVADMELADRNMYHMVSTPLKVLDMPVAFPKNTYPEGSKGHTFLYTFEEI